jgi:hypothetical protein
MGCYTYSRGNLIGVSKIEGSQTLASNSYEVALISGPTSAKPEIVIQLQNNPTYKISTVNQYQQLQKSNAAGGWITTILGGGLIWGGTRIDTLQSGGETFRNILYISGLLIFFVGIYLITLLSTPVVTKGKVIEGEKSFTYEKGLPIYLDNSKIVCTIGNKTKSYTTDYGGQFKLNLKEDFNLKFFSKPNNITVNVSSRDPSFSQQLTLNSNLWTVPYIKIEAEKGWIFEMPSGTSYKLAEFKQNEIYQITNNNNVDWIEIQAGEKKGWIPSQVGTVFWSVPN